MPNQVGGDLLHTMDVVGLSRVRTELYNLFVIPFLAPHPEQTDGEFTCHGYLGDSGIPPHRQVYKLPLLCLSWKWRERSSVKITERTYEKRAQALHR